MWISIQVSPSLLILSAIQGVSERLRGCFARSGSTTTQTGCDVCPPPPRGQCEGADPERCTSSEPSAQSWSPSHFHLPAMQRPLAHENSLSEQGRGAGDREHGVSPSLPGQQRGGHRVTQTRGRWRWGQAGVQAELGELPADTTSQRPPRPAAPCEEMGRFGDASGSVPAACVPKVILHRSLLPHSTVGKRRAGGSSRSRKGQVGTDFGAKYEPCTGPSPTVAPVEEDAGAQ